MDNSIPIIIFTAIPSFFAGFTIGGYVARKVCVMNRWRKTRNRIPAKEIVAAMRENAKKKEGGAE
jgi:hypothetical protein